MQSPSALRDVARAIFTDALAACSVEAAFSRKLSTPTIDGTRRLAFTGDSAPEILSLDHVQQVRIIAFGKASAEMLRALLARIPLPSVCSVEGVLIARHRPADLPAGFRYFAGGHPLPNEASFDGARAALDLLQRPSPTLTEDQTLCLFLISGGASAMMELPLEPRISLQEIVAFHQALVHSGASITEINCVRKHLSAVKGGRLAVAAAGHRCLSLLVSDVPPAQLDALASGPTLPDSTTVAQCREIVRRYNLSANLPPSVAAYLDSPALPETPKPGDLHASAWTMLDSTDLASTAAGEARRLGFYTVIDNTPDDWDFRDAAEYLLRRFRELRAQHGRVCLLSSGEVTVQVSAPGSQSGPLKPGKGGRNQHFLLYLATLLEPAETGVAALSAGSDGIDGNSNATGAVIDEVTIGPARASQARRALEDFDSSSLLGELGATIVTGPTGNNLRDLRILLAE